MTLYPPHGTRGFGPRNAIDYGLADVKQYVREHHKTMCRFVQIEHVDFVKELEVAAKNPFADGFIFGANDLSGSVGELTETRGEKTQSLIRQSIEILNKNNKCIGLSTDDILPEQLSFWHDLGIHMISAGAECGALTSYFKTLKQSLRNAHTDR